MNKKSLLKAFLSLFLSFMLLLAFCSTAPVHAAASWNVQTVDTTGGRGSNGYCPIIVDSNDNPSIAYAGIGSMKYAKWDSSLGGFSIQRITVATGPPTDVALDATNDPNILYSDGGVGYASWTGLNWTIQTVDTAWVTYAALALDSAGNPHAAYYSGQALTYASRSGSTWTTETVDNGTDIQIRLSLALDSNDKPYIMYSDRPDLKLATLENSGWKIETVTLPGPVSSYGNMVLYSKGHPHLIYSIENIRAPEENKIKYASWTGFSWKTQTVASSSDLYNVGDPGVLALDSLDYPHICFISSGGLMYAVWTGVEWNIQPVDSAIGRNPVYLAVDSHRIPHISYRLGYENDNTNNLMYATATEPVPLSPPTSVFPLLLVITAVTVAAVIAVVAFVWKRKTQSQNK